MKIPYETSVFIVVSVANRAPCNGPLFQKVGMARRRRPSLTPDLPSRSRAARRLEAALYPRDGASRLMFGTPAARRHYLFNDLF
jgi:hypothetical protein